MDNGPKGCDADAITEVELKQIVVRAINIVLDNKDEIIRRLEQNIESVLSLEDSNSIESINRKLEETQEELLKLANAHKDYTELLAKIEDLREQKKKIHVDKAEREALKLRIAEMRDYLENQIDVIEEYDDSLVRRMIEKITFFDDYFTFEFKSGVSIDIRR